jgi:hypothetical protein
MDYKKSYSEQEQYEYFIMMKNDMKWFQVCDRDIKTLQILFVVFAM